MTILFNAASTPNETGSHMQSLISPFPVIVYRENTDQLVVYWHGYMLSYQLAFLLALQLNGVAVRIPVTEEAADSYVQILKNSNILVDDSTRTNLDLSYHTIAKQFIAGLRQESRLFLTKKEVITFFLQGMCDAKRR